MEIKRGEPLKNYTTFRMGGSAETMYFPQTVEDVRELTRRLPKPYYVISGGSNLLINDARTFEAVICMRKLEPALENRGNGEFFVSASVRLQELINVINQAGYGGMEYLYSLPALVGGAVLMNAGRGRQWGVCISDYLTEVKAVKDGELVTFRKEECAFAYRTSRFQSEPDIIIVGASFRFPPMSEEETTARKRERLDLCKRTQDMSAPTFGTVFSSSNRFIMGAVKRLGLGSKKGIFFSQKTGNWMLNKGGNFSDAERLIRRVETLHRLLGRECVAEVRIWK